MTFRTGSCDRDGVPTIRTELPTGPSDSLFERIVYEYLPTLRKLAVRLAANQADADDLVADTLERALAHFGRLAPGSNVRAWLVTILRNRFWDGLRSQARHGIPVEVDPNALPEVVLDDEEDDWPEVSVDDLDAALDQIDEGQRAVFELFHLENLSYAEIAERLGIPTNTVGSRLVRARNRLCKILKKSRS